MADDLGEPLSGRPAADPIPPLVGLSVASAVELTAAAVLCASYNSCAALDAFAVCAGCVSTACCLLLLLLQFDFFDVKGTRVGELTPHIAHFLLLWWLVACFSLTFISPFGELSNGFFACWAATVSALLLCRALDTKVAHFLGYAVSAVRASGSRSRRPPLWEHHFQVSTLSHPEPALKSRSSLALLLLALLKRLILLTLLNPSFPPPSLLPSSLLPFLVAPPPYPSNPPLSHLPPLAPSLPYLAAARSAFCAPLPVSYGSRLQ